MTHQPLFTLDSIDYAAAVPASGKADPRLCKATQAVRKAFPEIRQDHDYPYATGANWSCNDLLFHFVQFTGPVRLYAATWSVSEKAAIELKTGLEQNQFLGLWFLVDWRVRVRTPGFLAIAKNTFSKVRVSQCHAKAMVLENDQWCVSVVGSANFTSNPRIEAGHVSTRRAVGEFHRDWILAEINNAKPFGDDMNKIGKKDGRK